MSKYERSGRPPGRPSISDKGVARISAVVASDFKDRINAAIDTLNRLGHQTNESEFVRTVMESSESKWVDLFLKKAS